MTYIFLPHLRCYDCNLLIVGNADIESGITIIVRSLEFGKDAKLFDDNFY